MEASVESEFKSFVIKTRSIFKSINLARMMKAFIIVAFGMMVFTFFERRLDFLNLILQPILIKNTEPVSPSFLLKKHHITLFESLLNTAPEVNSVVVVKIDVRQNIKEIVYKTVRKDLQNLAVQIPDKSILFGDNVELNRRTITLMGGEMACMQSTAVNIGYIVHASEEVVKFSCATPIPPTYGEFSGWVFVGFDRPLSATELVAFKAEITKISAAIKRGA